TIGEMEHLDAATLEEFQEFKHKFYSPNNAVLVVAGDFDMEQANKWIKDYFGTIPRGPEVKRETYVEDPITTQINTSWEDPNVTLPMMVVAYRTPSMKTRDARILDMISTYLSGGKSSVLYKKLVDQQKKALEIGAFAYSQEDYGSYILFGIPMGDNTLESLLEEIDVEIAKLQKDLISERDFQKLQNIYENQYVSANSTIEGIAHSLAEYYLLYGDVNLIKDRKSTRLNSSHVK